MAAVPKSYKPPVFLEERTAKVTEGGTVSLECQIVEIPSPNLKYTVHSRAKIKKKLISAKRLSESFKHS